MTVHLNDAPHSFLLAFLQGPELIGINEVCVLETETVEFILDLVLVLVKELRKFCRVDEVGDASTAAVFGYVLALVHVIEALSQCVEHR